ncbi:MAG: ribosome maturation factor RimM [Tannerellaceae bacterium]|nr:ribosome maturation factor RimM [Tannerellaceae bacterium]MCD8263333.1 ribosome maturation factor RimM [Tannerellaceae bacterium]
MIREEEVIKIGYFAKPHGIKGEVSLVTRYDVLDASAEPYLVCDMEGILVPFYVEEYRYKTDNVILVKLENINDEVAAARFANKDVFYPLTELEGGELQKELAWEDFIGYTVIDTVLGKIGPVTDVDESTMNVLFSIDREGKEVLIPVAEEFIEAADHTARSLTLTLPEGVLDL